MKKIILFILIASAFMCLSCSAPDTKSTRTGFYFDTTVSVTILTCDNESEIFNMVWDKCRYFENCFSTTKEDSDLYKINHANGTATVVSEDTIQLLDYSLSLAKEYDGILDPSIGCLKKLWNLNTKEETFALPSESEIEEAIQHVDYTQIFINEKEQTVTLQDPNMELDLGYIAKGYIADRLSELLKNAGVKEAVLNLGGNIVCYGRSDEVPFHFGIQEPFANSASTIYDTYLANGSIVTSGIYERYREYQGNIYSHILNPMTGYPVDNSLYSVSVITKEASSMKCDAYSTLLMLLGPEKGLALVNQDSEIEAVFVLPGNQLILSNGLNNESISH